MIFIINKYIKQHFNKGKLHSIIFNIKSGYSTVTGNELKTSLYDLHIKNGGKIVNFAGVLLPVQYEDMSVSASHVHTRNKVSLFDVSHMLQSYVKGKDCLKWIEYLCPIDLVNMADNSSSLTVFLNEKGGILDDLIVTKIDSQNLYIVSNAGRKDHDMNHMLSSINDLKKNNADIDIHFCDIKEKSLIALQGPEAAQILQKICDFNLSMLNFMNSKEMTVAGVKNCRVTRCGYTGEDGFEISMPSEMTVHICETLLQFDEVKLAGLGARDSLRLEAGLCLYGNDIDENTTPVEANLTWLIQKRRRQEGRFIGSDIVLNQIKTGVDKRRVGFRIINGPPARRNAQVLSQENNKKIGFITSGCPSPSLGGNVAMGYVEESYKKLNTNVFIEVRNNKIAGEIVKMPFLPAKYYVKQ